MTCDVHHCGFVAGAGLAVGSEDAKQLAAQQALDRLFFPERPVEDGWGKTYQTSSAKKQAQKMAAACNVVTCMHVAAKCIQGRQGCAWFCARRSDAVQTQCEITKLIPERACRRSKQRRRDWAESNRLGSTYRYVRPKVRTCARTFSCRRNSSFCSSFVWSLRVSTSLSLSRKGESVCVRLVSLEGKLEDVFISAFQPCGKAWQAAIACKCFDTHVVGPAADYDRDAA